MAFFFSEMSERQDELPNACKTSTEGRCDLLEVGGRGVGAGSRARS